MKPVLSVPDNVRLPTQGPLLVLNCFANMNTALEPDPEL